MGQYMAFLGGTLPLPLITQRYIAGQNTPCKCRRFESASAEGHEIRCMVRVRGGRRHRDCGFVKKGLKHGNQFLLFMFVTPHQFAAIHS